LDKVKYSEPAKNAHKTGKNKNRGRAERRREQREIRQQRRADAQAALRQQPGAGTAAPLEGKTSLEAINLLFGRIGELFSTMFDALKDAGAPSKPDAPKNPDPYDSIEAN